MSLQYSLLLQQELTFEKNLKPLIHKYDITVSSVVDIPKGKKIDTPEFSLSIVDTSDIPFGWESELLNEEYTYIQSIGFYLDKSSDLDQTGSNILEMVIDILDGVNNALLLLNDSVVFYWDGINLFINNEFGFWDIGSRIQIISNKNYSTLEASNN